MLVKGPAVSNRLPMSLKLRIRSKPQSAPPERASGYRIRPVSFLASLVVHSGVVAILLFNPMRDHVEKGSLYREIIQPQEHKIIFYDFRQKLPEVKAAKKIGNGSRPRGLELSNETMIAASPDPKSSRQFIWQAAPKIELPRDLQLPNLIARANTALPAPPPTEIKKPLEHPAASGAPSPTPNASPADPKGDIHHAPPKAFVAPIAKPLAQAPAAALLEAPVPDPRSKAPLTPDVLAVLRLKRTFVLPPPEAQANQAAGTPLLDTPAAGVPGTGAVRSTLPAGLGAPTLSAGIAPPPRAPLGTAASTGNGNADLAIAGLNATGELKGPLPDGSRSGRFSKAPELGEPSSGDESGSGALNVPGLSIHAERKNPAAAPVAAPPNNYHVRAVLYADTVRGIATDTLSAPLRPSSRTVPSSIDARFEGRAVYTMVVPIENLPDYCGDWILWFAERQGKPGDAPSMRAPVPFRKLQPVSAMLGGSRVEHLLQIAAVIKQDGRLDRISLLRRAAPAIEQAVVQDLESWEFKPALRDGQPVDVDVVIEIPFNLTAVSASTGSK